uniref:DNA helicase n=1 Tax=Neospora caninum (strain Liverpool) TaxID=572307 RepID=A0A0F7UDG8_NEOCL|nr:TPA: DNA-binding protein, putative [Neospora caninum Liverpool]
MTALDRLVDLHQKLLKYEHAAETEELESALKSLSLSELEAQGVVLPRLVVHQVRSGLYSRTLVDFCTRRASQAFQERQKKAGPADAEDGAASDASLLPPQHRFTPGDIVGLFDEVHALQAAGSKGALASGVVHKVRAQVISIAFEDDDWVSSSDKANRGASGGKGREDEGRSSFHLALISSSVTIERQLKALDRLKNYAPNGPAQTLLNLCFGFQQPQPLAPAPQQDTGASDPAAGSSECADGLQTSDFAAGSHSLPSVSLDLSRCGDFPWFCPTLTVSQKRAVLLGLRSRDLALIHGPPGTGKSTALLELLLQLASRGCRVLACAPSNVAVDNLLERIAAFAEPSATPSASGAALRLASRLRKCVRLGHPARVDENLARFCLESQLQRSEGAALSREIRRELDLNLEMLKDRKKLERHVERRRVETAGEASANDDGARPGASRSAWSLAKRELREEIRTLRKELRAFERKAVEEVLEQCPIVFATCAGADDETLRQFFGNGDTSASQPGRNGFDVVALEAVCWIPLLYGHRAVLAGDHCQLAPTIKSRAAERGGLGITLFERQMQAAHGSRISQLLDTQFRMHRTIMDWSNEQFYKGELRADESVASRLLEDKYPRLRDETSGKRPPEGEVPSASVAPPFLWIDTAGVSWLEEDGQEDPSLLRNGPVSARVHASKSNRGEAALLVKRLQELVWNFGVDAEDICVITPYRQQVQVLRQFLREAADAEPSPASVAGARGEEAERETRRLRQSFARIPVNTVDGFQGKEGEVVAISLVRSNPRHEVGFLKDVRRLNVAVTRAKRHLLIVGDSETIGGQEEGDASEPEAPDADLRTEETPGPAEGAPRSRRSAREILRSLFQYASEKGEIRSALEFIDISQVPGATERKPKQARETPSSAAERKTAARTDRSGWAASSSGLDPAKPGKGMSRAAAKKKKHERKLKLRGTAEAAEASGDGGEGPSRQRGVGDGRAGSSGDSGEAHSLEAKYRSILVQFVQRAEQTARQSPGASPSYTFPSSLTAYERKIVHALAVELGLSHVSLGTGEERQVVVSVRQRRGGVPGTAQARHEETKAEAADAEGWRESPRSGSEGEAASVRESERGRCGDGREEGGHAEGPLEKTSGRPQASLGKKKKGEEAARPEKGSEDDFDALLESLSKEDWTCGFSRCQASTKVLGRTCPFCRKRFCFSHSMPEIHGCGDAASAGARKSFRESVARERRREEEKRSGSGLASGANSIFLGKSYAGNAWAQSQAQQKLRDKIEQEKKKRTAKKKEEGRK